MNKVKVVNTYNKLIVDTRIFILISLMFIGIMISQFVLFINGDEISGIRINDYNAWKVWLSVSSSTIASIIAFYSTTKTVTLKSNFFYYQLASSIFFLVSLSILFVWYSVIRTLIALWISYKRWVRWKEVKNKVPIRRLGVSRTLVHFLFAFAIAAALGGIMILINNYSSLKNPQPFLDALNITLGMYASVLMISSPKESWII